MEVFLCITKQVKKLLIGSITKKKHEMRLTKKLLFLLVVSLFAVACSSSPEGEEVEAQDAADVENTEEAEAQTLKVDTEASLINWLGTKPAGQHEGTLKVKSGELKVKDGNIMGGSFVIDMTTINVTDLEGEDKADLEKHLTTGDFFEVDKYNEAKFEIVEVKAAEGEEGITHRISGNLTLKGETKLVNIPANVTMEDNKLMAKTPQFTIDRTEWGIVYKSSKIGEMAINDKMGITINLVAI